MLMKTLEMLRKLEIIYEMERSLFEKLIAANLDEPFHSFYINHILITGNPKLDKSRPNLQIVLL
jgi:hypothetical protein